MKWLEARCFQQVAVQNYASIVMARVYYVDIHKEN